MAHFYANIKGNRSERTACGTKNSGISGHIRGWNIGGKVQVYHNDLLEKDGIIFHLTGGSNYDSNLGVSLHYCPETGIVRLNDKKVGTIINGKFVLS